MTGSAIIMMIIAILLVWGGLAVAIVFLARHPLEEQETGGVPEKGHIE